MRNNIEHNESEGDVIKMAGGEVEKAGRSAGAAPDLGVADAEVPSLDEDKENRWSIVTRGQKKGPIGPATGKVIRRGRPPKPIVVHTSEDKMADELRRNREELVQLRELVTTLTKMVQKLQADSQASQAENKAHQEKADKQSQKQTQKIELLHGVVEKEVRKPSYSEALQGQQGQQARQPTRARTDNPRSQSTQGVSGEISPRLRDERVVSIDTISATSKDFTDLVQIKDKLQQSINSFKVVQGLRIQCLRPLGSRGVDVVFETEEQAEKAKSHPSWVSTAIPGAKLKRDTWYPVKCDGVAKQVVLDETAKDGRTLRHEVVSKFKEENSTEMIDCTVMKASWLSKNYPNKTVGSMVIYMKVKAAADHLLRLGNAIFGPVGATCSQFERLENDGPCFNCNKYGHKQTNCSRKVCCGKCSGNHNTRNCDDQRPAKCPACTGAHTIFEKKCPQHPRHMKIAKPTGEVNGTTQPGAATGANRVPLAAQTTQPSIATPSVQAILPRSAQGGSGATKGLMATARAKKTGLPIQTAEDETQETRQTQQANARDVEMVDSNTLLC